MAANRGVRIAALAVFVGACGRVAFDPLGDGDGGAGAGDVLTFGDSGQVIPAGLVVWYPMEEDFFKTGVASDASGHGLDAGCTLCPVLAQGHKTGSLGAHFNGAFMYFYRPQTAAVNLATFTVAAWVFPERVPTDFEIFVSRSLGTLTDNSFAVDIDMNRRAEYFSAGPDSAYSMGTLQLSQWAHVAITFDGTDKRVYLDGVLDTIQLAPTALVYDSHPMLLGADSTNEVIDHYFQGSLDDVMMFDRALTPPEILALAGN